MGWYVQLCFVHPTPATNPHYIGMHQNGRYALGNFTVFMPGKHENIIAMEKFYPMLKSTQCTDNSITMKFKNERSYYYGYRAWKWVNDAKNRHFLLVAGKGHCGYNAERLPFVVKNVHFDNGTRTIKTIGEFSDWETSAHSYELSVGGRPSRKRDFDETFQIGVGFNLPLSHVSIGGGSFKLTYDCSSCATTGDFNFDFHVKTWLGIPDDFSLIMTPQGVGVTYTPTIGIQGTGFQVKPDVPLGTIPIGGFSIGGIVSVGPKIQFTWTNKIQIKGSAGIQFGGTLSFSDSAVLTMDMLAPSVTGSGWSAQFSPQPFTVDAAVQGLLQTSLVGAVEVGLNVMSKTLPVPTSCVLLLTDAVDFGLDAGFSLGPFAGVTISDGVCK